MNYILHLLDGSDEIVAVCSFSAISDNMAIEYASKKLAILGTAPWLFYAHLLNSEGVCIRAFFISREVKVKTG